MPSKYNQNAVSTSQTRFTSAPMGEIEFSTMHSNPVHLTDFSAGELVPIYCAEVLPHDCIKIDMNAVIRQATCIAPTMGQLYADFYAFFVPNRVVNRSWKNVMGENTAGAWAQPTDITLAPLYGSSQPATCQVPLNSVADYYGFPTQQPLRKELLQQCNDLKFRGYVSVWNNYFRSQSYMPPLAVSNLNIFQGFFAPVGTSIGLENVSNVANTIASGQVSDGSFSEGSVVEAVLGEGSKTYNTITFGAGFRRSVWSALDRPLKVCKMHDYFTSVLPTPQRGQRVAVAITGGQIRLNTSTPGVGQAYQFASGNPLSFHLRNDAMYTNTNDKIYRDMKLRPYSTNFPYSGIAGAHSVPLDYEGSPLESNGDILGTNLYGDISQSNLQLDISELRNSAALQQYYEILGRGGGRYREFINSFFGLDIDNPFEDIPTCLGHFRRELDLFQTAQTSATNVLEGSPQGTLAAFGYTDKDGSLIHKTFLEHGYIHIFCVVRHKNVYSTMLARDNFRMSALDFYSFPFANISEQPVYTREINPFTSELDDVFGFQEAWAEYRMESDRVSGRQRPQISGSAFESESVAYWNYADNVDTSLRVCDGDWLMSNTAEVVSRTTAVTEETLPQFKAQFKFFITKERPMPTYSVAGIDIL